MTTTRRLTVADLPEYATLLRQGLSRHPACFRISPEDIEQNTQEAPNVGVTEQNFTLGAFSNTGALVGIVSFARDTREKMRHKGLLFRMYVAVQASGQGIGRQLVRECIAQARTLPGLETVTLTVVASNFGARHLYLSEGFVPFALEPRALKMGIAYFDEEQMRLDLTDMTD